MDGLSTVQGIQWFYGNTDSSIWCKFRGIFSSSATGMVMHPLLRIFIEGGPGAGARMVLLS